MRKVWKLFAVVVVMISIVFVLSCDNMAGLSEEDLENLEMVLGVAFYNYDAATEEWPTRGITGETADGFTVTWTDYVYETITVNGSLVITMSPETLTTGIATVVGTLTFTGTGLPIETLKLDIIVSYDLGDMINPASMSFVVSGTVTIDGTEHDASGLTNQDVIMLIMQSFMSLIPSP